MKKTKIICTIGPSSSSVEVMSKMAMAGMDVARINFTHASNDERSKIISNIKKTRALTKKNIAICFDTKGPEFRTGVLVSDYVELIPGLQITIVKENVVGDAKRISVNHPEAIDSLNIGDLLLLDNDRMRLRVVEKTNKYVTCVVLVGGRLGNHKSISVPGVKLNIPYVSDDDIKDLEYACQHGGEYLAISFVSSKLDVLEIKNILKKHKREDLQIIAKIENVFGVNNLEEILEVVDGIMIARGDLGTEIASEKLPVIQKYIIRMCRKHGKVCIVATEMLETMIDSPRPKRAETSDIANAVLDGTDAVMLSSETAIGRHPVEAVQAMVDICSTTEEYAKFDYIEKDEKINSIPIAIAESAVDIGNRGGAKIICVTTITGKTARLISNYKPRALILALCPNSKTCRSLALNWGVYGTILQPCNSTDEIISEGVKACKEFSRLRKKDIVIITGNFPYNDSKKPTNLLKIEEI